MEELDDKVFDKLVQEKRFNDIIDVLKQILSKIEPDKDNSSIEALLNKIILNQSSIPKSIVVIGNAIANKLDIIANNQNKDWKFDIKRNNVGLITTVTAKQIN